MTKPIPPEIRELVDRSINEFSEIGVEQAIARALLSLQEETREACAKIVAEARVRCDRNQCQFVNTEPDEAQHQCRYSDGFDEWRYDRDLEAAIRREPIMQELAD